MLQTTKVHIGAKHHYHDVLYSLCYHSARMYNVGLYSVRQHFFNTEEYLSYYDNYHECKTNENYSLLLTDTGQQILRLVDRDVKSFFHLLKLKKEGKYSNQVHLPSYKDKNGVMTFATQGRSIRIKEGKIYIGLTKEFREKYNVSYRKLEFTIPKNLLNVEKFNEVRVIPMYGGIEFSMEFIYDTKYISSVKQAEGDGFMSIDLGVDNLMACTIFSNGQSHQFLVDGKRLKSINAYYNKMISKLNSQYSTNKTIESPSHTKRMLRLYNGRNNRINDYLNKSVCLIIDTCLKYGVSHIVIGYNKGQKQEVSLGSVNNQNFVCIPYYKLRQKLSNKCLLHGIEYIPQEESYTSKSSAIDNDFIPTYGEPNAESTTFSGKRLHRGLYRSSEGFCLNADINGSINIFRKYLVTCNKDCISQDLIRALVNAPCKRVNPLFSSTIL
ncbi:MAG: transposase [Bacilli bacterium]|nr:transposase [Bacilli bacterium]